MNTWFIQLHLSALLSLSNSGKYYLYSALVDESCDIDEETGGMSFLKFKKMDHIEYLNDFNPLMTGDCCANINIIYSGSNKDIDTFSKILLPPPFMYG